MEVTFELTVDDFYDGLKACRRKTIVAGWALPLGTAALTLLVIYLIFQSLASSRAAPFKDLIPLVMICVFCLIVSIVVPLWRRSAVRKQFEGNPSTKGLITLAVSESEIRLRSHHTDSSATWSSFVMWSEGKSVFAIMVSPVIYYVVPKRAFSADQLIEFQELLRLKIRPEP
jgi:hypothetical protein